MQNAPFVPCRILHRLSSSKHSASGNQGCKRVARFLTTARDVLCEYPSDKPECADIEGRAGLSLTAKGDDRILVLPDQPREVSSKHARSLRHHPCCRSAVMNAPPSFVPWSISFASPERLCHNRARRRPARALQGSVGATTFISRQQTAVSSRSFVQDCTFSANSRE